MALGTTFAIHDGSYTISNTVTDLSTLTVTDAVIAAADTILISVSGAGINYRVTGEDPTSSVGHPVAADNDFVVVGQPNIRNLKMIRNSGSDATIFITVYSYSLP